MASRARRPRNKWKKFNAEFGKAVLSQRRNLGWTQVDLSQRSGIPVKTISRIENAGKNSGSYTRRPHVDTIEKLVGTLEIERSQIRVGDWRGERNWFDLLFDD